MLKRYIIILILFFTTTNLYASSLVDKNDKWPNAFDSLVLIQSMPSGFGISPYEQFFGEENQPMLPPGQAVIGSGFWISDIHIVTNYHVVKDTKELTVWMYGYPFAVTDVKVIGYDPIIDIAVLEVERVLPHSKLKWAKEAPGLGDDVYALGHGLSLPWSLTKGVISTDYRANPKYSFVHYYQTDAVINSGNSGGPLMNEDGEVVGINTLIISPTKYYVGYGYAIPLELSKRVVNQLIQTGKHVWPSIGIKLAIVEKEEQYNELKAKGMDNFLEIKTVTPGSSAEKFGLLPKDIILSINDKIIYTTPDVIELLWTKMPGDILNFKLYRDNEIKNIQLTLGRTDPKDTTFKIKPKQTPEEEVKPKEKEFNLGPR